MMRTLYAHPLTTATHTICDVLTEFCTAIEDLKSAIDAYQKALIFNPKKTFVIDRNLAEVFRQNQQLNEAIAAYQKALELNPDHVPTYKNLGDLLQKQGKIEEAISMYQKVLKIQPNHEVVQRILKKIAATP